MSEPTHADLLRAMARAAAIMLDSPDDEIEKTSRDWLEARAAVFSRMVKPIPYARCTICTSPLDMPGRPWTRNCGGDCLACMAEAGDPECVEAMKAGG